MGIVMEKHYTCLNLPDLTKPKYRFKNLNGYINLNRIMLDEDISISKLKDWMMKKFINDHKI